MLLPFASRLHRSACMLTRSSEILSCLKGSSVVPLHNYRRGLLYNQCAFYSGPIVQSPFKDVVIPRGNISVQDFILNDVRGVGEKIALVDGVSGKQMTFAQLQEAVSQFGSGLARRGLKRGDPVAVFMPNCPEFGVTFLGALSAGCVVSTVNTLYTAGELEYQLKDVKARALVVASALVEVASKAAGAYGLQEVIVQGLEAACERNGVNLIPFSTILLDSGSALPKFEINNMEEVAVIPYSSGTTGTPKGVQLSHFNIISNVAQVSCDRDLVCFNRRENETILAILPFFHIYGMTVMLLSGIYQHTRLVTLPKFDPELFLSTIEAHKVSQLFVVPPIVVFLCKHPMVSKFDLSSVYMVFSGAAPLGGEVGSEVSKKLNCKLFQGYGLTELSPVCHVTPFSAPRAGSCGVTITNTEAAVLNDGQFVGSGVTGEICIRGPQVMMGYLNRPDATAEMITPDGWLRTGDVGHYDDEGYFFVTDRLKELIKRKGFQVAPAELERELLLHPDIVDAAVIGVPDERQGELPRGFVVRREGSHLTEKNVMDFMAGKVAAFKQLDGGVMFVDSIPKSASGKILRRQLRHQ